MNPSSSFRAKPLAHVVLLAALVGCGESGGGGAGAGSGDGAGAAAGDGAGAGTGEGAGGAFNGHDSCPGQGDGGGAGGPDHMSPEGQSCSEAGAICVDDDAMDACGNNPLPLYTCEDGQWVFEVNSLSIGCNLTCPADRPEPSTTCNPEQDGTVCPYEDGAWVMACAECGAWRPKESPEDVEAFPTLGDCVLEEVVVTPSDESPTDQCTATYVCDGSVQLTVTCDGENDGSNTSHCSCHVCPANKPGGVVDGEGEPACMAALQNCL